ncbi:MAG: non-canonical purine NTP pyrophosphatase [Candidatus Aenigmatarchaeota archaeon]|nr:MAG: non-canonical purine NTP pyrophosphatase [Candidatus Aenigmarchaeota archaeon]
MKEVLFISGNRNKAREVNEMLGAWGISVKQKPLEIEEIQDKDVEKVAGKKAEAAFSALRVPVLVEDTGLHIEAMNGYPGSLIRHFIDSIEIEGILGFLKGKKRSASAVTAFAYCDHDGVHTFRGEKPGRIADEIKTRTDFDWDCIFIPEGHEVTYSQLSSDVKNSISQRRLALERFADWFQKQ